MENSSQPLATDSFSYSWLINSKPSFDALLESLRPSLDISSDDSNPIVNHFDFNLHPPESSSRFSINLVHADEIISNGLIKSVFVDRDRQNLVPAAAPVYLSSVASWEAGRGTDRSSSYQNQGRDCSVRKCKKASGKVLQRCYALLRPICRRLGCSRTRVRVDDLDRKVLEVRSWSNSFQASPERRRSRFDDLVKQTSSSVQASPGRTSWAALRKSRSSACERLMVSPTRSPTYYRSDASESSIHEAILHCKRSFAN